VQVDYYRTQFTFTVLLKKSGKIDSTASKRSGDRLRGDSQGAEGKDHSRNESSEEHRRIGSAAVFGC